MCVQAFDPVGGVEHPPHRSGKLEIGGIVFEFAGFQARIDIGDVRLPFLAERKKSGFDPLQSVSRIIDGKDVAEIIGKLFLLIGADMSDEVPLPVGKAELMPGSGIIFLHGLDDALESVGNDETDPVKSPGDEIGKHFPPGMGAFFGKEIEPQDFPLPVRPDAHDDKAGLVVDFLSPDMETDGVDLDGETAIAERPLLPGFPDRLNLLCDLRDFRCRHLLAEQRADNPFHAARREAAAKEFQSELGALLRLVAGDF